MDACAFVTNDGRCWFQAAVLGYWQDGDRSTGVIGHERVAAGGIKADVTRRSAVRWLLIDEGQIADLRIARERGNRAFVEFVDRVEKTLFGVQCEERRIGDI